MKAAVATTSLVLVLSLFDQAVALDGASPAEAHMQPGEIVSICELGKALAVQAPRILSVRGEIFKTVDFGATISDPRCPTDVVNLRFPEGYNLASGIDDLRPYIWGENSHPWREKFSLRLSAAKSL